MVCLGKLYPPPLIVAYVSLFIVLIVLSIIVRHVIYRFCLRNHKLTCQNSRSAAFLSRGYSTVLPEGAQESEHSVRISSWLTCSNFWHQHGIKYGLHTFSSSCSPDHCIEFACCNSPQNGSSSIYRASTGVVSLRETEGPNYIIKMHDRN